MFRVPLIYRHETISSHYLALVSLFSRIHIKATRKKAKTKVNKKNQLLTALFFVQYSYK